MDFLRAAILGIVQGLSEFLPISSSGHLILIPALFKWDDQGLAFDVGLHMGTLLALLAYFWRDWVRMFGFGLADLKDHHLRMGSYRPESQLLWLIALGSLPAAVTGLLLESWIEDNVRQPWLVAVALAVVGTVMLVADRRSRRDRELRTVGLADAVLIGVAQACALVPGVSRSGATMSVALFRNFSRDAAARFAFLLGTPAFVGAAILKAPDIVDATGHEYAELAIGFACSAVVGFAVIHWLLRFLRTRGLLTFVVYRYGVAVVTLAIGAVRVS